MDKDLKPALEKIRDFYLTNKRSPTYEEVAKLLGFASKNASFKLIKKLIDLDILAKDGSGKIIPRKLFKIPITENRNSSKIVDTDYLKNVVDELLDATHSLAEAHPLPKDGDNFLRTIEATFRRDTYTLLAIAYLAKHEQLADSAMDLVRKMIEDTISIEYMIANGKEEMAKKFQKFYWVQLHQDTEFLKTTGADFKALGVEESLLSIEKKYQNVRADFIHKPTGEDLRSWIGKDLETMLEELNKNNALSEHDISRTVIGYIKGCWKNHFNPYDVNSYLTSDWLDASSHDAMNQALVFGATCLYRLTTRYIDHIRYLAKENFFEDEAKKIAIIWEKLNPPD